MRMKLNPGSPQIKGSDHAMVKTEEAVIVLVIIVIWMSLILLFIKKWGRIRTLEPRCFLPKELLEGGVVTSPDVPSKSDRSQLRTCSLSGDRAVSPCPSNVSGRNSVIQGRQGSRKGVI